MAALDMHRLEDRLAARPNELRAARFGDRRFQDEFLALSLQRIKNTMVIA